MLIVDGAKTWKISGIAALKLDDADKLFPNRILMVYACLVL
jgi:hypothetical protein